MLPPTHPPQAKDLTLKRLKYPTNSDRMFTKTRIPEMIKQTIASQQSEAVCIRVPGDLIGDDPPEILLGHTMAVEADQTHCSDCDRKKRNKLLDITGTWSPPKPTMWQYIRD